MCSLLPDRFALRRLVDRRVLRRAGDRRGVVREDVRRERNVHRNREVRVHEGHRRPLRELLARELGELLARQLPVLLLCHVGLLPCLDVRGRRIDREDGWERLRHWQWWPQDRHRLPVGERLSVRLLDVLLAQLARFGLFRHRASYFSRFLPASSAVGCCRVETCVAAPRSPTLPDTATLTSLASETPLRCSRIRRLMILWNLIQGVSPPEQRPKRWRHPGVRGGACEG